MIFEHSLHPDAGLSIIKKNSVVKTEFDHLTKIRFCEINTVREFEKSKKAWNRLLQKLPGTTPFQSWEWNYAVIKELPSSVKLKIMAGYNSRNEIVGFAPFKLTHQNFTGIKILEFVGNKSSDYLDFIVKEEYRYSFTSSLFDFLIHSKDWTIINLINLREETRDLISHYLPAGIFRQDVCPYIHLPDTMKEYENEMHKKELKNIKRQLRKLLPGKRLEYIVKESPESLKDDVDTFIELHQERHHFKGERGRFFNKTLKGKFHYISKLLSEAGILRIEMLKIDSEVAAINYMLVWNNGKYNYLSGMNPAFSNYKPGKILIYYMIEDAIKKGCRVFDFLQGAEEYKYSWTNRENQLYNAVYSRSKLCLFFWRNILAVRNQLKTSPLIKKYFTAFSRLFSR